MITIKKFTSSYFKLKYNFSIYLTNTDDKYITKFLKNSIGERLKINQLHSRDWWWKKKVYIDFLVLLIRLREMLDVYKLFLFFNSKI